MKLELKLIYTIIYNAFKARGFDCAQLTCWEATKNTLTGAEFDAFRILADKAAERFSGGDMDYCLVHYRAFYDWCRFEFDPDAGEEEA